MIKKNTQFWDWGDDLEFKCLPGKYQVKRWLGGWSAREASVSIEIWIPNTNLQQACKRSSVWWETLLQYKRRRTIKAHSKYQCHFPTQWKISMYTYKTHAYGNGRIKTFSVLCVPCINPFCMWWHLRISLFCEFLSSWLLHLCYPCIKK